MIDVKQIAKAKTANGSGGSSSSTTIITGVAEEAKYAAKAGKAEKATFADQAEKANDAVHASRSDYASVAGKLDENSEVYDQFIRKDQDDSTQYWVTFLKGLKLGEGDKYYLTAEGVAALEKIYSKTPYLDIAFGLKTDPDNALKGRLGNLQGIYHHLFGWLEGFGEYLNNLYAVGDFRLRRTGESLDQKIDAVKD